MYRRMNPWVHELVKLVDNSTVNHLDGISCGRMLDGLHTHCWFCWRYGNIPLAVNMRSFDFVLMCRCASGSSFNFSHVPNILKKSREDTRLHVAILPCDTFYHFQDVKRGYFEILSAVYFTFVTRNSRNKRSQGGVWQCSAGRRVFFFPFQYSRQRFYVAFCNTCCSKRHWFFWIHRMSTVGVLQFVLFFLIFLYSNSIASCCHPCTLSFSFVSNTKTNSCRAFYRGN